MLSKKTGFVRSDYLIKASAQINEYKNIFTNGSDKFTKELSHRGWRQMKKILLAASSGGHLEQIMCLKALQRDYECVLVTEDAGYQVDGWQQRTYYLPQVNRKEKDCLIKLIKIFKESYKILKLEKPDVIVTTGALAVLPMCLLSKKYRIRLIYIESFAKVHSPTITGRVIYRFTDVFIVQWKSMLEIYPNAIYGGAIY